MEICKNDISVNIDRMGIQIPVYVAHQQKFPNPFPLVTDFTEISSSGVVQTESARKISPVNPDAHSRLYHHSDFMMAEDHLAGKVAPGEPGASVVADTMLDWILTRSKGRVNVPQPDHLSVERKH